MSQLERKWQALVTYVLRAVTGLHVMKHSASHKCLQVPHVLADTATGGRHAVPGASDLL